jgi:hypothetical protein
MSLPNLTCDIVHFYEQLGAEQSPVFSNWSALSLAFTQGVCGLTHSAKQKVRDTLRLKLYAYTHNPGSSDDLLKSSSETITLKCFRVLNNGRQHQIA